MVLSAYALAFGGLLLLGGRAAYLLGRRRVFMADALTILLGTVAFGLPFVLTLYAQQVLGYSALRLGAGSAVLAVAVTAGATTGQAAVGKAGFRPAAVTGLALMADGSLVLTQVSAALGVPSSRPSSSPAPSTTGPRTRARARSSR